MNSIQLLGRLTRDIDLRYSQSAEPIAVGRFSLAVDKKYKKQGEPNADFINCVVFGKQAETLNQYVFKGHQLAVQGRLQTGSYTNKDGQKVYTTDVIVDGFTFCNNKSSEQQTGASTPKKENDSDFAPIDYDIDDDDLPF